MINIVEGRGRSVYGLEYKGTAECDCRPATYHPDMTHCLQGRNKITYVGYYAPNSDPGACVVTLTCSVRPRAVHE
jgi:hypothetical protein